MRVAIFDFDGTLYERETFHIMMDHLKRHPVYHKRYKKFLRSFIPKYVGSKLKIYPEDRMREQAMRLYLTSLQGITIDELHTFFAEIAKRLFKHYNQNIIKRIQDHYQKQDYIMLVSGAYRLLLEQATKDYPFHSVIGTDIPIKDRKIDLSTSIEHIQGLRKNKAIHHELKNKSIDWKNSYAYADSFSDLPVLELVGHPVAVRPEKRLYEVAVQRGWEII